MIKTRKDLKFFLQEDAKANRMEGCSLLKYWVRLFIGSEAAHVYKYYKVRLHRLGFKYNIRIPENICGYGLSILHIAGCGGCLVNAKKVGNYCKLQTGVLMGNTNHSEDEKPTIGNNVGFGPGAKVLGKVTIGDNSFVAANAVVVKDMPANSVIGGVPAKVIKTV